MSRGIEDESDDDKIAMLSQKSQHTSLGNTEIAEDDIGGEMNWFKMRIELPKLQIEVHPKEHLSDLTTEQSVVDMLKSSSNNSRKYQEHNYDQRAKLGTISLEGLRLEFESKSSSEQSIFKVDMDSLWVHDPNVRKEIDLLNKNAKFADLLELPEEYVLKTVPDEEKDLKKDHARQEAIRNTQRMTTAFDGEGNRSSFLKAGKLFSLSIETVKMDDYKKMRNAAKGENANQIDTIVGEDKESARDLDKMHESSSEDDSNSGFAIDKNDIDIDHVDADEESRSLAGEDIQQKNRENNQVKEYHTNVVFNINGQIIVYSNFFFIKKVMKLVTGIAKDMEKKRTQLTQNINDAQVLENIIRGFDYLKELKAAAYKRMEEAR